MSQSYRIPHLIKPESGNVTSLALPASVQIQPDRFSGYVGEGEEEATECIRWKYAEDEEANVLANESGQKIRVSNTNIVEFEDGNFFMFIGDKVYPLTKTTGNPAHFVYSKQSALSDQGEEVVLESYSGVDQRLYFEKTETGLQKGEEKTSRAIQEISVNFDMEIEKEKREVEFREEIETKRKQQKFPTKNLSHPKTKIAQDNDFLEANDDDEIFGAEDDDDEEDLY